MTLPVGYYAVPDPEKPDHVTTWRIHPDGELSPWPRNARPWPVLYRRDVPRDPEGREQARAAHRQHVTAWVRAVEERLEADPPGAAALFADTTVRCSACARALTDDTSKALGIGPECRRPPGPRYDEEEIRACIRNAVEITKPGDHGRSWRWDRPIQGRPRKREVVTVARYRVAAPPPTHTPQPRTCSTVLDRLNSGRPVCTDPVVWRISEAGEGLPHSRYYCDADMPDEYRPPGSGGEAHHGVLFA